jgi:hypothetical protein
MPRDSQVTFEGTVQDGVRPDDTSQDYRVWKALLTSDDGRQMDIRVGEWFWGALYSGQRLKVVGDPSESPNGRGELVVHQLTDLDTGGAFSRHQFDPTSAIDDIQGDTLNVADLTFKGKEGWADIAGYAFDLRTENGELRKVIARGRKCEGPILANSRKVRLSGMADAGGVIHTQQVDFVRSSGTITVTPTLPRWPRIAATEALLIILALAPWVAGATAGAPEMALLMLAAWSVFVTVGAVLIAVRSKRYGHRT